MRTRFSHLTDKFVLDVRRIMEMLRHSPEPWRVHRASGSSIPLIVDKNGLPVVYEEGVLTIADARRIVACVNAMAGVEVSVKGEQDDAGGNA